MSRRKKKFVENLDNLVLIVSFLYVYVKLDNTMTVPI